MLLYEGKAKSVFSTKDPSIIRLRFNDKTTAFNGLKKENFKNKGMTNCVISTLLMGLIEHAGIETHLIQMVGDTEQLCHSVDIIPVEVVIRNIAAGSICRRLGLVKGYKFNRPIVELFYKSDDLNDPLINDQHAIDFGWATLEQLDMMRRKSLKINDVLQAFWLKKGITLVDFKLEFGVVPSGKMLLADEVTPDGSRLWDVETGDNFDKDVFRYGNGELSEAYDKLLRRITELPQNL